MQWPVSWEKGQGHWCSLLKALSWDFPGSPVVKNLPLKAGDAGLIPGPGTKILHALEQLSLCTKLESPSARTKDSVWCSQVPRCCNEDPMQPNKEGRKKGRKEGRKERQLCVCGSCLEHIPVHCPLPSPLYPDALASLPETYPLHQGTSGGQGRR